MDVALSLPSRIYFAAMVERGIDLEDSANAGFFEEKIFCFGRAHAKREDRAFCLSVLESTRALSLSLRMDEEGCGVKFIRELERKVQSLEVTSAHERHCCRPCNADVRTLCCKLTF